MKVKYVIEVEIDRAAVVELLFIGKSKSVVDFIGQAIKDATHKTAHLLPYSTLAIKEFKK